MTNDPRRVGRVFSRRVLGLVLATVLGETPTLSAQVNPRIEAAPRATPAAVTLTDVLLKETGAGQYLLRIQADGPLAFDRLTSHHTRQVVIRFYNARLAQLPPWDAPRFGVLSWASDGRGNMTLSIDLMNAYLQANVTQAGHPNIAEIRVRS